MHPDETWYPPLEWMVSNPIIAEGPVSYLLAATMDRNPKNLPLKALPGRGSSRSFLMSTLLIKNATLVATMDEADSQWADGGVFITDNVITAVGRRRRC